MTVVSTLDLTGLTANEYRNELPALVPSLPGAPSAIPADAR